MRRRIKIIALLFVAAVGLSAAPALAADGLITINSSPGGPLPICVNTIRVTVSGNVLVDIPKICIPPS